MKKVVNGAKLLVFVFTLAVFSSATCTAVESSTASHNLKLNIYDSTSLDTILETCDQIKADQEKNHTYTDETYNHLMEACEGGHSTLDCLHDALQNNTDASECNNPDDEKDHIDDAINKLVPTGKKPTPPNTDAGSTWIFTLFGKTYAISTALLILLSCAALLAIILTIYLIQKRIGDKGINGIRIKNPWNKNSYERVYESKLAKKHEDDPLTEIIDVSQIIRKYRIKFILWHTIPMAAIVATFFALLMATAQISADSQYADISLVTTGNATVTIINIDKKTAGNTAAKPSKINQISTNIHNGGVIDADGGVFAKYTPQPVGSQTIGQFTTLLNNMTLTATKTQSTAPGSSNLSPSTNIIQSTISNPDGVLLVPATFDHTTLDGQHTFNHTLAVNLANISNITNGTYNINLTYTLTVDEPVPVQEFTFTVSTRYIRPYGDPNDYNCYGQGNFSYRVMNSRGDFSSPIAYNEFYVDPIDIVGLPYDWDITIDKGTSNQVGPINFAGETYREYYNPNPPYNPVTIGDKIILDGLRCGEDHTITITSNGSAQFGWARAYGLNGAECYFYDNNGIESSITHLNTPLPLRGFMESSTSARHAFTNIFGGCEGLENSMSLNVSNVDTSKITNFSYMFSHAHRCGTTLFTNKINSPIDISNLNTSGGVNFAGMFAYTHSDNGGLSAPIDISGLNTSHGVDFSYMFAYMHYENHNLSTSSYPKTGMRTPINLSNLDVSSGTNFTGMFAYTHGMNYVMTNVAIGQMRFHDSFKSKYALWDKTDTPNNTFAGTFAWYSRNDGYCEGHNEHDEDTDTDEWVEECFGPDEGAEPRFNDGTVLSSAGSTGLVWGDTLPYADRTGIVPAPVNDGWI
ncbi:BspA family leucine-rich repeat surface protein [Candidatus Saccharibacteria bacterium]|nr:BspA family leucine-rich repeat surface protein [Candidatus Saccharibacteria bacterium]MCL1963292.1 BspA family leucine-rich repeat surface protein [Candidatus Saccharibacteria bacterium]